MKTVTAVTLDRSNGTIRGKPSGGRKENSIKRYNLALPDDLFHAVQEIATQEHTTVLEVLRKFVKLGLIAADISRDPKAKLLIREGDSEREIVLL